MADELPLPQPEDEGPKPPVEPLLLRMELFLQVNPEDKGPDQTIEDRIRYALGDMLSDMIINIHHRFDIKIEDKMIVLVENHEKAARFTPEVKLGKKPN